jgi:predicted RNase H-like HicB family nuclease
VYFAGFIATANVFLNHYKGIFEIEMTHPKKPSRSVRSQDLRFNIETEREMDGRWIAEISDMPGVLAYGKTEAEARAKAYALALRVIADDVEKSKDVPASISVTCQSA